MELRPAIEIDSILNHMSEAFVAVDQDLIITAYNPAAGKLSGNAPGDLTGKRLFDEAFTDLQGTVVASLVRRACADRQASVHCPDFSDSTDESRYQVRIVPTDDGLLILLVSVERQMKVEEALRESEQKYQDLFEKSGDAILIIVNRTFVDCNRATIEMLGYASKEEFLDTHPSELSPERQPDGRLSTEKADEMMRIALEKGSHRFEWDHVRANGEVFPVEVLLTSISIEKGDEVLHTVWRDITERKFAERDKEQLQSQLNQVQKLESIGRLAGGVAHDSNNMLGVILGNVELGLDELNEEHPLYDRLKEIESAATRSAELTQQLLAFARKQTAAPRVLNLNRVVSDMHKMLIRLIGENIDAVWHPGDDLWPIKVDPTQMDQIFTNLLVNARDAIDGVGEIVVTTENVEIDESFCASRAGFVPGEFVRLSVCDDGRGMDRDIQERIFEPFFTTKKQGYGSGLGLATVFGIVKQNNGYLDVESAPGAGTTFSIYFPRYEGEAEAIPVERTSDTVTRGRETIMIVEDEPLILSLTERVLSHLGYSVLTASTPGEAIGEIKPNVVDEDI